MRFCWKSPEESCPARAAVTHAALSEPDSDLRPQKQVAGEQTSRNRGLIRQAQHPGYASPLSPPKVLQYEELAEFLYLLWNPAPRPQGRGLTRGLGHSCETQNKGHLRG